MSPLHGPGSGGGGGEGGGSAAFGGVALWGAQAAKTSGLKVYLLAPIVDGIEAVDWTLSAAEASPAAAAVSAQAVVYTNLAQTQGIRITLAGQEGTAGNGWIFYRTQTITGVLRIERIANLFQYAIRGPIPADYTAAQLLALINVTNGLMAVYFGGEDGSSIPFSLGTPTIFGSTHTAIFSGGVNATPAEVTNVSVDAANSTINARTRITDTFAEVASALDAIDGLGYDYFGGADDTTVAARPLMWSEEFELTTIVRGAVGPAGAMGAAGIGGDVAILRGAGIPVIGDAVTGRIQLWVKTTSPFRMYFHSGVDGSAWIPISNETINMIAPFVARMRFIAAKATTPSQWNDGYSPIHGTDVQDGDSITVLLDYPNPLNTNAINNGTSYFMLAWPALLPDPILWADSDSEGNFGGAEEVTFSSRWTKLAGVIAIGGINHTIAVSNSAYFILVFAHAFRTRFTWDGEDF